MPTDPRDPASRSPRRRTRGARGSNADGPAGDDFWGGSDAWADVAPLHQSPSTGAGGRLGRWWNTVTGAGSTASRTHGSSTRGPVHDDPTPAVGIDPFLDPDIDPATTRAGAPRRADTTSPTTAAGPVDWHDQDDHAAWDVDAWEDDDDRWDAGWDVEPAPVARPGLDPLIARFGAVLLVVTIAVPVVMGFTSGADAGDQLREVSAAVTTTASPVTTDVAVAAAPTPAVAPVTTDATSATTKPSTAAPATEAPTTAEPTSTEAPVEAQLDAPAPTPAPAPATTVAACSGHYELAAGDYWIRIADAAGVRLADLLAANGASVETVLVPGRTVCLPAGASMPSPPVTTTAAPSTTSPATTQPPTTQPPTTAAPTTAPPTTAAPTTTSPPPPPVAPGDVEAIIRSVWPDDLEDQALRIAWRESNYVPTAKNYCCYGLFQIYWSVHQSWLDDLGVTSATQLYDPATNARAAYTLYQRAGGFGPWGG